MKRLFIFFMVASAISSQAMKPAKKEFYEIRIYHIASPEQEAKVDAFLRDAYLPAIHRAGIKTVGVFKPISADTANAGKMIYVYMPLSDLSQVLKIKAQLDKDAEFLEKGKEYLNATYDNPPYQRIETILIEAFRNAPTMNLPNLTSPHKDRIYELRSYEGHTEKIYENKVHMFNEGDEIGLFKRLGFNAVFYGNVIAGSRIPNLMYMTTFENRQSREDHWNAFRSDPQWKKLSGLPEYQHNVSKADILLLYPTDYSDF